MSAVDRKVGLLTPSLERYSRGSATLASFNSPYLTAFRSAARLILACVSTCISLLAEYVRLESSFGMLFDQHVFFFEYIFTAVRQITASETIRTCFITFGFTSHSVDVWLFLRASY